MYMDIAERVALESHAVKLKVGAVFVSPLGVVSTGINGLPSGGSNVCETIEIDEKGCEFLKTKPDVLHAEENLVSKLLQQGVSTIDGVVFLTHSPCINCAKILYNAGIKSVYYKNDYRSSAGIDFLQRNGIHAQKGVEDGSV